MSLKQLVSSTRSFVSLPTWVDKLGYSTSEAVRREVTESTMKAEVACSYLFILFIAHTVYHRTDYDK